MNAYELLYTERQAAEDAIAACDRALGYGSIIRKGDPQPAIDNDLINRRRHHAIVAVRYDARIKRLEVRYDRD